MEPESIDFGTLPDEGHVGVHGLKCGAWNDLQTGARSLNCPSGWDQKAQILGPWLAKESQDAPWGNQKARGHKMSCKWDPNTPKKGPMGGIKEPEDAK